jgi:hypothetical protein
LGSSTKSEDRSIDGETRTVVVKEEGNGSTKTYPRSKSQVTRNPHAAVDGRLIFIEEGLGGFEFQRKGEER